MTTEYFDLIEVTDIDQPRTSSLGVSPGIDQMRVVGILPHGYCFRPKTARDRDNLVDWLIQLEYGQ